MLSELEASIYGETEKDTGLPAGFLDSMYAKMGVTDPDSVLHLCSGPMKRGVTVDIRPNVGAKYVCDARHTPFDDASFQWIVADPPPLELIHSGIYGLPGDKFPTAEELLLEAERLLIAGGKVCVMCMCEPATPPYLKRISVTVPLLGPGYFLRGAFLYERIGVNG